MLITITTKGILQVDQNGIIIAGRSNTWVNIWEKWG